MFDIERIAHDLTIISLQQNDDVKYWNDSRKYDLIIKEYVKRYNGIYDATANYFKQFN